MNIYVASSKTMILLEQIPHIWVDSTQYKSGNWIHIIMMFGAQSGVV